MELMDVALKKNMALMIMLCIVIFSLMGCVYEKEQTLVEIEKLLFNKLDSISTNEGYPGKFKPLSNEQIKLLRSVICDGTGLTGIVNAELPDYYQNGYIQFKISKTDCFESDLIYCREENYCYISKIHVNYEKEAVYKRDQSLIEKYLMGIYKFRPSKKIRELLRDIDQGAAGSGTDSNLFRD
jgi:hypothetical protein